MENMKFYKRFNERLILQLLVVFAIVSMAMLVLL